MLQLLFIFRILRSWKYVFHFAPFRPKSYVLMRLWCLEVSNLVRNWNKVKNFIFVRSKLELCKLEIPIFIYKLMCWSSLIDFFISVLWIYSCNELKGRQKYYFSKVNISNSQIEILVSFSRSTNVNVNMSFPNSNFNENLLLMCLACHFDVIESWIVIAGQRDT